MLQVFMKLISLLCHIRAIGLYIILLSTNTYVLIVNVCSRVYVIILAMCLCLSFCWCYFI